MIPGAVFVAAATQRICAFQEIFEKFWVYTKSNMFCRSREGIQPGSSRKVLGAVMGVRRWRVPLAGLQVTVFLFRRLCQCRRSSITTVQRWCWIPTIVCAVTTPFHGLCQAVAYLGFHALGGKVSVGTLIQPVRWQDRYEDWAGNKGVSKADSAPKHILPIMKNNIFKKNVLAW